MKGLLIFSHIPQDWKKNNPATSVNRWIHEWNYYFVGFFLSFFNGEVVLWQPPPNYQEAMPAGHYTRFVHSLFPLTFSPSRIIKQNKMNCYVILSFFFFRNCKFFTLKKVPYSRAYLSDTTLGHVMSVCQLQPNWVRSDSVSRAGLLSRAPQPWSGSVSLTTCMTLRWSTAMLQDYIWSRASKFAVVGMT